MKFRIFVYGTLKRGEPNHYVLKSKENGVATFIDEGKLTDKYPLVIGTQYNIPFLLDKPGLGKYVLGEVYSVDRAMLAFLDDFEGHPTFYERRPEPVLTQSGDNVICSVYFLKRFKLEMLSFEIFESYTSTAEKPYLERYQRDPDHDYKKEVQPGDNL